MKSDRAQKTGASALSGDHPCPYNYCVRTATLVAPRTKPPASLNSTMMRLLAGSNGTLPVAVTNTEYVGVAPPLTGLVVSLAGADRQTPVPGLVSQMVSVTFKGADVLGNAVMVAVLPAFTVATAKAVELLVPARLRIPSPLGVLAIATISGTGLDEGDAPAQRLDKILCMYERFIGHVVNIDMRTYLAETRSGDLNKAIAYLLRHFGMLENEVDDALSLYLQQCSAIINCEDLSIMAATLANGGINPLTRQRAIQEDYVGDLLTVMYTCGMYDFAGEWSYRIGLPAKRGVSGGILAVVPGQMVIAVYSPRLDRHGNSIAGIKALEAISAEFDLHVFPNV
jgi:hypothetical protein